MNYLDFDEDMLQLDDDELFGWSTLPSNPTPTAVVAQNYVCFDLWCAENGFDPRDKSQVRFIREEKDLLGLGTDWSFVILHTTSPIIPVLQSRYPDADRAKRNNPEPNTIQQLDGTD